MSLCTLNLSIRFGLESILNTHNSTSDLLHIVLACLSKETPVKHQAYISLLVQNTYAGPLRSKTLEYGFLHPFISFILPIS